MIKKILDAKDNKLRKVSKPVKVIDKKILSLIKDLKDTLSAQKDPEGIGLAASQIGVSLRVFIMKPSDSIKVVINPQLNKNINSDETRKSKSKLTNISKQKNIMEGCLSLPHFYSPIERAKKIKIRYLDIDGNIREETFKGLDAQIVQHEIDHLDGLLFIDRILEQKKPLYEYVDGEWEKVEL